jgi:Icc-related predicted phosphoesterase
MRIYLHSDLHMEFGERYFIPEAKNYADADVIVLAGDIHHAERSPLWIHQNFGGLGKPIVYVAGNHEYYDGHWRDSLAFLRSECAKYPEIHFLEDDCWTHPDGVRFMGASLWTSFTLEGKMSWNMEAAARCMNDYRKIEDSANGSMDLNPVEVRKRHLKSRKALKAMLASKPEGVRDVVVTHHAPHPRSISEGYVSDDVRSCYATNLRALVLEHKPTLWLHGHIHDPVTYLLGTTRVASNPADYPMERTEPVTPLVLVV